MQVDFCEKGKRKQLEMWVTILWVVVVTPGIGSGVGQPWLQSLLILTLGVT